MQTTNRVLWGLALGMLASSALAQDRTVLPVEAFVCGLRTGMDMTDLDSANAAFNRWADGAGLTGLTSLMLVPHFYSEDTEADVIGMEIWESGAAMGRGIAQIGNDDASIAEYIEVLDCSAHQLYALVGIKPPAADPVNGAVFEFANCTLNETRSPDEGIDAITRVTELWADWDIGDAHAALFPVAGETSDADYTFKWLTYYPSIEAFGNLFDRYAAGAVETANGIVNPVMSCDSSRMYDVNIVRISPDTE